ncbi:MAG: RNA polymerase sigma factor [Limisphaerales bacterium]
MRDMMTASMTIADQSDAELAAQSQKGNRDAFGLIIARYQSLICSLAYSATGNLCLSEDLAQDTFFAAWKQLAGLREPEKLRAWLCGIARNLINNSLRKQGREPTHRAESLGEISEVSSSEPLPREQTISREEEAILWRSLEQIPEIYREPLVLFYREHQSVETVAQNLDLSQDAVHQRLSRGRKILQEQVLAFIAGALEKTAPDQAFTMSIVAALPALAAATNSATVGATAAKGGTAIKILFMTKTTQAIIVAAVTATVILTTQTAVHHFQNPPGGHSVERLNAIVNRIAPEPLTPERAAQAKQTAQDFFDAMGKGDWKKLDALCPPGFPMSTEMDDQQKSMCDGLEVISLGDPYTKPGYPQVWVPYEIKFKSGDTKKYNLAVRQDNPEHKWYFDGGF